MKLPPRLTFSVQMVAGLWSSVVQIVVMNRVLSAILEVCSSTQPNNYTCPNGRVFFIGPARMFSLGQTYSGLLWFFLVGTIVPVAIYIAARLFPKQRFLRFLNAPLTFGGAGLIPPATPLNYISWGIVGFLFNKVIRDRFRGWWMQYNYVLSAGLDVGLALCTILIFIALNMTSTSFPEWWGTRIASDTMDMKDSAAQIVLPEGETFGPRTW